MSNIDIINNKISSIKKYIALLATFKSYSEDKIRNDAIISGAIERYAYLAVQAAIDLAEAIISYKSFRKPTTMAESFVILKENDFIAHDLCDNMIKMVGFRNILAHDYEDLDFKILYSVLQEKVSDIEKFIDDVKNKLKI